MLLWAWCCCYTIHVCHGCCCCSAVMYKTFAIISPAFIICIVVLLVLQMPLLLATSILCLHVRVVLAVAVCYCCCHYCTVPRYRFDASSSTHGSFTCCCNKINIYIKEEEEGALDWCGTFKLLLLLLPLVQSNCTISCHRAIDCCCALSYNNKSNRVLIVF